MTFLIRASRGNAMLNIDIKVFSCVLLLLGFNTAWGVSPPNPTASDADGNTAGGTDALVNVTTSGAFNTAFGKQALAFNTSGSFNTSIGADALFFNSGGGDNTAIGYRALFTNVASFNTALGTIALSNNTTGIENTASGAEALNANTTGNFNTADGFSTLHNNLTGSNNTANGDSALFSNTTGVNNTANGSTSLLSNTTGNFNTADGFATLFENSTGNSNIAIGAYSLHANTTGSNNASIGKDSQLSNIAGSNNTALGFQTLKNKVSGNSNLALGVNAGINLTSGSNNVYLANGGTVTESATIRIGVPSHTRTFVGGIRGKTTGLANAVQVVIDGNGQLGTVNSSARFKKDIQDMNETSNKLMQLRPVTYHYKQPDESGENPLEYGLIAEEVAKVYPDLVAYGADGKIETVQYQKLTPMLLNELQNMNEKLHNEQLKNQQQALEIASLKTKAQEVAELKQQVLALTTQASNIAVISARLARIEAQQTVGLNR
jgi:Chaperone of endosialidase